MNLTEEQRWMLDAGRGDREAFALVITRYQGPVLRFISRYLSQVDREVAEDLTQDVFLRAWKAAANYSPKAKVITYLLRLATNSCLNHQRAAKHRRHASLFENHRDEALVSGSEGGLGAGEWSMDRLERQAKVRRAIADLPQNQRAAIVLRHYHELSYVEISEVLDISASAVESLLFRARTSLRAALTKDRDKYATQELRGLRVEPH